tara:strand:- start:756 stop:1817 length:1062 start_codon:yes stop_codon:yes gene_type:complete
MNRLKNLFTGLLFLLSLLSASDQRVRTLGGNPLYWPEDDSNIEYFPHLMSNYNIAQISGIGDGSDSLYGKFIWGNQNKYGFSWYEASDHEMLNFYIGMGSLGLRLGLLSSAADTSFNNTQSSELGLSGSVGINRDNVDIGLHISSYSSDDGTTSDQHERFKTDFYFRTKMDVWNFTNITSSFHYASSNDGFNDNVIPVTYDLTLMQGSLGLSDTIKISDNSTAMLAISTSFISAKNVDGYKDLNIEIFHFPNFTFGVEGKINNWAKARIGINKNYIITMKVNQPGGATNNIRSGESLKKAFGLGFNYSAFNLDMYVHEGLFTNPVQRILGFESLEPATGPNSSSITATVTYTW